MSRGWRDSLQITAFVNEQREGRREIRSSSPQTALQFFDQQEVLGFNLELGSASSRHAFVYGLDFTSEDITSRRTDVNLLTGATRERRGNFIDSAGYQLLGVYVQDRWKISNRLGSTLGLRYSRYSADGTEATALGVLDLAGDDSSLTASAGIDFAPTRNLKLLANATQGLRAPNLEDLSIINERPEGTEIGNPQLSSEAALMLEVGFKYYGKSLELTGFAYRTELDDLFERSAGTFEGLPFFDLDGDGVQDPGEPNVLQRQNIGEATIDGFELEWTVHLRPEWRLHGNYTSTRGTDTRTDEPLRRIPPDFGLLGLRWAPAGHPRRAWAELVLQSAAAQRRLNREDVTDDRIGPGGTDGFNVFHLRGGLRLGERFRATLALENLGDERYKIHGSGIYRPGFQAVVQGELSF